MLKKRIQENNLEAHTHLIEALAKPCLDGREDKNPIKLGCSKVGGHPHVNDAFSWPIYRETPLEFVAQINLEELTNVGSHNLPQNGLLLVFYAQENFAYKKEEQGCFRVIYIPDTDNLRIQEPEYQYIKRLWGLLEPKVIPENFSEHRIQFDQSDSLPDLDNADEIPSLSIFNESDELLDSYCNLKYDLSEGVLKIGGYPDPVQFDGIVAGAAEMMEKGSADDWELLLQVDSHLGFMWGDAGRLYFSIHKDDLAEANFNEVWMEFQCH